MTNARRRTRTNRFMTDWAARYPHWHPHVARWQRRHAMHSEYHRRQACRG